MSCNRENVIWPSKNGTWNIGFYDYTQTGEDHEWDVEYDYSRFHWASTGHSSKERAMDAWQGANPGSHSIHNTPSEEFDKIVQELRERARKPIGL